MPIYRDITFFITNNGAGVDQGIAPAITSVYKVSDGNAPLGATTPVLLTRIGKGWYKWNVQDGGADGAAGIYWPDNLDVCGIIDADPAGLTIRNNQEKYIPFILSRSEARDNVVTLLNTKLDSANTIGLDLANALNPTGNVGGTYVKQNVGVVLKKVWDDLMRTAVFTTVTDTTGTALDRKFLQVDTRWVDGLANQTIPPNTASLSASKRIADTILQTDVSTPSTAYTTPTSGDFPQKQLGWILKNIRWKKGTANDYSDGWIKVTLDDMKGFLGTNINTVMSGLEGTKGTATLYRILNGIRPFDNVPWDGAFAPDQGGDAFPKVYANNAGTNVTSAIASSVWTESSSWSKPPVPLDGQSSSTNLSIKNMIKYVYEAVACLKFDSTKGTTESSKYYYPPRVEVKGYEATFQTTFFDALYNRSVAAGEGTAKSIGEYLKQINDKTSQMVFTIPGKVDANVTVGSITVDYAQVGQAVWNYDVFTTYNADTDNIPGTSIPFKNSAGRAQSKLRDLLYALQYKTLAGPNPKWWPIVSLADAVHGFNPSPASGGGMEEIANAVNAYTGYLRSTVTASPTPTTTTFGSLADLSGAEGSLLVFSDPAQPLYGVARRIESIAGFTVTLSEALPFEPASTQKFVVIPDRSTAINVDASFAAAVSKAILEEALGDGTDSGHDRVEGSLAQAVRLVLQVLAGSQKQYLDGGKTVVYDTDGATPLRTVEYKKYSDSDGAFIKREVQVQEPT